MKYFLFFLCGFLFLSCNENGEVDEFVEFIQTDAQGNIIGEDIEEQWSPRNDAPLITKPAYPNPVSNLFVVEFELQQSDDIIIEILDRPGHVMGTLLKTTFESGEHKLQIQANSFSPQLEPNKIYQIQISSNNVEIYGNIKYQE